MHAPSFKTYCTPCPQLKAILLPLVRRRVSCVKCDPGVGLGGHMEAGSVHTPTARRMGQATCEGGVRGREYISKSASYSPLYHTVLDTCVRRLKDVVHLHTGPSLSNPHQCVGRTSMWSTYSIQEVIASSEGWGLCWSSSSLSHLPTTTTTYIEG